MSSSLPLPFDGEPVSIESRIDARDRAARARAVDPRFNVALEASAGTGKTRVLVDRYINLLREGVDPSNILAITFTRKAAAEMRERIVTTLRAAAERGEFTPARWRELRDRTADIAISTIDAFCLSLLREFPLEADLDPGFSMADDTEVPRLIDESLDRALRICRGIARDDEHVALVFAQLGDRRARRGLAALLHRRIVAPAVLARYLSGAPRDLTIAAAARHGAAAIAGVFDGMRGGLERFVETGPLDPAFQLLKRELAAMSAGTNVDPARLQAAFARLREHFLTQEGEPRKRLSQPKSQFASIADWEAHRHLVVEHGVRIKTAYAAYRRDLNVLVSRGVSRMFRIAETEYRRTLDAHAVLDFSDVLLRALELLRQMEEFAQSRYRLESRYHHVLVDEFQDTSRAQWELVSLLIQSWGEGAGLASTGPLPPSVFIVGDRKQSIYGFRDADVAVLREASRHLDTLRPDGSVRRSISRSFRSVPAVLSFINDVCRDMEKATSRRDAFSYDEDDRFPLDPEYGGAVSGELGLIVGDTPEACAETTAATIARLIAGQTPVRDRDTGVRRPVRPGDFGILFRTRESHREYEDALERRGVPSYVYKGLGFFDADEIKDVLAVLWYLADPLSDLRTAAWLRSRFVRLSDEGLRQLAPGLADAVRSTAPPPAAAQLDSRDADAFAAARVASARWRRLVDRVPPAELLDVVLTESAYAVELRGPRQPQARENLKKMRALIRRIQNRGYATLGRIAAHLDRLAVGDEANAVIDAMNAVNLMTVHAAKGLEFPIVFIVNLSRGTGNRRDPIRVAAESGEDGVAVAVGDFQSNADDDDGARDREETKRLLYVALTRARDRLYLATPLKDGRMVAGRGSLAEVMPATLLQAFGQTMAPTSVEWVASSGTRHTFAIAANNAVAQAWGGPCEARPASPTGLALLSDFRRLVDSAPERLSVAAATADATRRALHGGRDSDRLAGTLVHRLLQRAGLGGGLGPERLRELALEVIRPEESPDIDDVAGVVDEVVAAYEGFRARPDLIELYRGGTPMHEVPFTLVEEGRMVRGTIDCLVRSGERVTILEFKTGRRRAEHEVQLELYRRAAATVFAGASIDARLVYADEVTR